MSMSSTRSRDPLQETTIDHEMSDVIGTWRLVSSETHASDGVVRQPVGYVVYTADGHVFVQIMPSARSSSAVADPFGGTSEDCWLALGYAAYAGTYELLEGRVVHHLEMCLFPPYVGVELTRTLEWDGDELVLTTQPRSVRGASRYSRLVWQRVPSGTLESAG